MEAHSLVQDDTSPGHLVQLLLPLRTSNEGDRRYLNSLREELTHRFGGVTAYLRAPAIGDWKHESERIERDEIVIVEVMVDELDRGWWAGFRERIRKELDQEELILRALPYLRL